MVNFAGKSDKGITRKRNEDAFCLIGGGDGSPLVLAVADGMGGHMAGDVASQMAIATIRESIGSAPLDASCTDAVSARLKKIVAAANDRIYKRSVWDPDCAGMGTTLTVAACLPGTMVLAHVGDSRAYHFRGGAISKITTDHTYVEELVKIGSLTREEARVHPKRNYITRAVGSMAGAEPDIYEVGMEPFDRLLLCTDGLSNMLSDGEIADAVYASDDPERICASLIEMSNGKGGFDNITALAFLNMGAPADAGAGAGMAAQERGVAR
ncbi:MAG: Stp1/IreP family PP2C-type Ser/Thr phosphatase [Clostridiales bacterium]|jgi:protein phosphatase|nr:Stp1/IreP family PP2C-type Ser/Thr phosphatase [Clostridiales bacterium]